MPFALLIFLLFGLSGCSDPEMDDGDISDIKNFSSPDGRYVVTTCVFTSHMTTGSDQLIYLRRSGEKRGKLGRSDTPGHLLTCDGTTRVEWTSPTNLLVEYHPVEQWISYPPASTNLYGATVTFTKR